MSKLQDYPYLSSISEDDKVLIVRNNDQGLAKISDLPIKGDVPQQLRQEMNAVFNKKFGTAKTYPPKDWPTDVNLMGALKEKTESGSIVYFEDGADDVPTKSWKITLPASLDGYSEVDVVSAGKNLMNQAFEIGSMSESKPAGSTYAQLKIASTKRGRTEDLVPIPKAGRYTFSCASPYKLFLCYFDQEQRYLGTYRGWSGVQTFYVDFSNTAKYVGIAFKIDEATDIKSDDLEAVHIQIEYGSTAHDYEPYTAPTQYTADLGRTIYGGTPDVVKGEGQETHARIKISDLNWTYYTGGTNPIFYAINVLNMKIYERGEMPSIVIDGYVTRTAHSRSNLSANMADMECSAIENAQTITFRNDAYTSVSDMLAVLGDEYIVYELATPTDFTFTGQEIPTRLGYNAFWSDSGDTEVTYRSNGDAETPITPTLVTKSIDSNGTYRAEDDDADGYSEVTVDIPSPTPPVLEEKAVTSNGTYRAEDDNADGYSEVTVNVPASELGAKTITQNGTYNPEDDNLDGYSGVTVNVPQATLGTKTITQNGTYQSSDDNTDGYSSVVVNVSAANLDSKEITQNGIYIPRDEDLDGYSAVSVNVAGPTLIEKEITENGTYAASDDNADGYSEVTVNTPVRGDLLSMLAINNSDNRLTLTDEVLNSTATKIRQYTFYKAYIGSINLNLIEEVEPYAFYNGRCSSIELPNCETLGNYAFYKINTFDDNITMHNLKKVKTIGAQCFFESHIAGDLDLASCESIGESAFASCSRITSINLPELKTIGKQAFNFCSWSFDISLPSIVSIGNNAFNHTQSVNFRIGPNCTSIGTGIFSSRNGVTNLFVEAETPPTLSGRFKGSGTDGVVNIFVPESSVDIYKAASMWSNYADKIQPIAN